MVFFTCNSCGNPVKKPAVEKHGCRPHNLSCIDCFKDFRYDEYKTHNKCISEQEKYAGEKANNKGEVKQEAWSEIVQSTLENNANLNAQTKSLLMTLTQHDNVPRKKPKFLNFIKNVAKNRFDFRTIDQVWDLLEARQKEIRELSKPAVIAEATNGKDENGKSDGAKKRKLNEDNQDAEITSTSENEIKKTRFSWSKEAMELINERANQEMTLKKLQKKLVRKFSKIFPESEVLPNEKIQKKLTKGGLQIDNGIVKLASLE